MKLRYWTARTCPSYITQCRNRTFDCVGRTKYLFGPPNSHIVRTSILLQTANDDDDEAQDPSSLNLSSLHRSGPSSSPRIRPLPPIKHLSQIDHSIPPHHPPKTTKALLPKSAPTSFFSKQKTDSHVTMEALMFNSHTGYLEGIVRGFKAGLITQSQYSNLTQCDTLDGQSLSFVFRTLMRM